MGSPQLTVSWQTPVAEENDAGAWFPTPQTRKRTAATAPLAWNGLHTGASPHCQRTARTLICACVTL